MAAPSCGEKDVAEPQLRPCAIENRLKKPSWVGNSPDDRARSDDGGFLERQKFAGRAPICEHAAIECVDALVRELEAQPGLGDHLDRLAELCDDRILGRVDREQARLPNSMATAATATRAVRLRRWVKAATR